jgi:hypothetical protein
VDPLSGPSSRWINTQRRRLLSASLALIYFWAFAALGLTHGHDRAEHAIGNAACALLSSGDRTQTAIVPAAAAAGEEPCRVCAAAHATSVALAQPPAPVHALVPNRSPAIRPASTPPRGSASPSQPRAPPQA